MLHLTFLFVGEGSSDAGLLPHLEALCLEAGADEVIGMAPNLAALPTRPGKDVRSQVDAALALEPHADLVFVHRDSDSPDPTVRLREITDAVKGVVTRSVPVVPVQELEAWLLLDEAAIRFVSGNPAGRVPLDLPRARRVEAVTDPKGRLKEALLLAAELSGRRRRRFAKAFPKHRRTLLERLDREGPLSQVPAWQALRERVFTAVGGLSRGDA